MSFSVELYDRTFAAAPATTLTLSPQRYGGEAVGGFKDAEITVSGPLVTLLDTLHWLRYYVIIRNEYKNAVWAGFITEAQVDLGGKVKGKTLENMSNRICVAYSYTDPAGNSTSGKTFYSSLAESTSRYGTKELVQSQGDSDATQAAQLRDTALAIVGQPQPVPSTSSGTVPSATLRCKGLWWTNSWRIYNQPGGVEKYDKTGSFDHFLGWGLSSNQIAFEHTQGRIHDLGARFPDLRTDDQIVVSGAANAGNNGTFTITSASGGYAAFTYTQTGKIFFEPTDDIKDNNSGLSFVRANELLYVTGSIYSGNNGYMFAKSDVGAYHITVLTVPTPATIIHDGPTAGQVVSITQGHSIAVSATTLVTETPANTITVAGLGTAVAQSFTLSVNSPFTVAEAYVRLKRVEDTSTTVADNVYVGIYQDSGGSPGASIEIVSVVGSTLSTDMKWVAFTFSNTNTLSYGTTYWIAVGRTGANSTTAYYALDLNEDAEYAGGTCKLFNGTSWVARDWTSKHKTADMPFQIWGHQQTSDVGAASSQIYDMLTYANTNNFFTALDIQDATGRYTRQYRDQDQNCQQEVEKLMKAGTSANTRLLASVTPDRVCHVYKEPAYNTGTALLMSNDGSVRDPSGQPYEEGKLPFGKWASLTGIPPGMDELVGMDREFIEVAEYDVQSGKLTITEKGAANPWDVVKLV